MLLLCAGWNSIVSQQATMLGLGGTQHVATFALVLWTWLDLSECLTLSVALSVFRC